MDLADALADSLADHEISTLLSATSHQPLVKPQPRPSGAQLPRSEAKHTASQNAMAASVASVGATSGFTSLDMMSHLSPPKALHTGSPPISPNLPAKNMQFSWEEHSAFSKPFQHLQPGGTGSLSHSGSMTAGAGAGAGAGVASAGSHGDSLGEGPSVFGSNLFDGFQFGGENRNYYSYQSGEFPAQGQGHSRSARHGSSGASQVMTGKRTPGPSKAGASPRERGGSDVLSDGVMRGDGKADGGINAGPNQPPKHPQQQQQQSNERYGPRRVTREGQEQVHSHGLASQISVLHDQQHYLGRNLAGTILSPPDAEHEAHHDLSGSLERADWGIMRYGLNLSTTPSSSQEAGARPSQHQSSQSQERGGSTHQSHSHLGETLLPQEEQVTSMLGALGLDTHQPQPHSALQQDSHRHNPQHQHQHQHQAGATITDMGTYSTLNAQAPHFMGRSHSQGPSRGGPGHSNSQHRGSQHDAPQPGLSQTSPTMAPMQPGGSNSSSQKGGDQVQGQGAGNLRWSFPPGGAPTAQGGGSYGRNVAKVMGRDGSYGGERLTGSVDTLRGLQRHQQRQQQAGSRQFVGGHGQGQQQQQQQQHHVQQAGGGGYAMQGQGLGRDGHAAGPAQGMYYEHDQREQQRGAYRSLPQQQQQQHQQQHQYPRQRRPTHPQAQLPRQLQPDFDYSYEAMSDGDYGQVVQAQPNQYSHRQHHPYQPSLPGQGQSRGARGSKSRAQAQQLDRHVGPGMSQSQLRQGQHEGMGPGSFHQHHPHQHQHHPQQAMKVQMQMHQRGAGGGEWRLPSAALSGAHPTGPVPNAGAGQDEDSAKRAELVESPGTRLAFKDFYRTFRAREKISCDAARTFAMECFDLLPIKVHWRLYLEIADLAKRENRFAEARKLYRKVTKLQPFASQGWLEYSKLEDESGDLPKCAQILRRGLMFCEYSETLLVKAIKHEERMGRLSGARELLSRLKHVGIEKVWRTVLEGALLESRAGNIDVARKVLKYLMTHVPWYGPIYYEAFRLEENAEHFEAALAIVEQGLTEIPRYGPLWFGAFRLCEKLDMAEAKGALARGERPELTRTQAALQRAKNSISKELVWKVHFEAAQIEERLASLCASGEVGKALAAGEPDPSVTDARDRLLGPCRSRYVSSVLACPLNLRWKVWLAGSRMELAAGNVARARDLLKQAYQEVPDKSMSLVFLECSRLEEFTGNLNAARLILQKARAETKSEWKVFLESVLLEIRASDWVRASSEAESALAIHSGAGRLWAVLVQLKQRTSDEAQQASLRMALKEVPKSGEVWCEGARIHLNPLGRSFDMKISCTYLEFAIQFTPQYGDSFMECLRLQLLQSVLQPVAAKVAEGRNTIEPLVPTEVLEHEWGREGRDPDKDEVLFSLAGSDLSNTEGEFFSLSNDDLSSVVLPREAQYVQTVIEALQLRCVNADPNYGSLWFHCRHRPSDTARSVLMMAKLQMAGELVQLQPLYLTAMVRHMQVEAEVKAYVESKNCEEAALEACLERLNAAGSRVAPPVRVPPQVGLAVTTEDFVTGLVSLNRITARMSRLKSEGRRKILFGSDQIVP
ncbi:unnamed protein product [Chrysoparadoxa australica]